MVKMRLPSCLHVATALAGLLGLSACAGIRSASVETVSLAASPVPPTVVRVEGTPAELAAAPSVVVEAEAGAPGPAMDGIGGAFNEQGWEALSALPAARRDEVLRALFDTEQGAALRFNRFPIGASDFALSAYSLDDTADDYELKEFSVKRDEGCLIPYLQAAQKVNPAMRFHASPWSPPGWMKTSGKMAGGGELKSDDRTLQAHANYLVKALQAYRDHGIVVDRLCPQNEPLVAGNYPGCKIPAPLYGRAVVKFIVPAVKAAGLPTEVWAGTFNYWRADTEPHFRGILADEELAAAVGGISFQYSHLPWVKEYRARHPQVRLQYSESQCHYGQNTEAQALRDFQDFAAHARIGCQLYTYWNMVLPEPHKSTWGWAQNSLVVVDKKTQTVAYQPSFAVARLLGQAVPPGSRCLPARIVAGAAALGGLHYPPSDGLGFMQADLDGGEQVVAFARPDGSMVVLLVNQGPRTTAEVRAGGRNVRVALPGKALCAIVVPRR